MHAGANPQQDMLQLCASKPATCHGINSDYWQSCRTRTTQLLQRCMQVLPCWHPLCWCQLPLRGAVSAIALLCLSDAATRHAAGCACVLTHFFMAVHSVDEEREKNRCSSTIALCSVR
jgi:hypothetical protein